jgi:alanine dehydrogenase
MSVHAADEVARALPYPALIEALRVAFQQGAQTLPRAVHEVAGGLLVVMPVWGAEMSAVKIASVFPANPAEHGLASVQAQVLLFDAATGRALAVVDGTEVTLRRTAAASALAASYLARPDAKRLLMMGAGALAPHLVAAHAAGRPIDHVEIWGRSPARAEALAATLQSQRPELRVSACQDPCDAAARADIISCATGAAAPILAGRWLKPGTHVDLVGSFSPQAREADDAVLREARIFVDTRLGAMAEAGDLIQPLASGVIGPEQIVGELADLCRGGVEGRTDPAQTTVFKSVGAAIEDLVAARMVLEYARAGKDLR